MMHPIRLTNEERRQRERAHTKILSDYSYDENQGKIMCLFYDQKVHDIQIRYERFKNLNKGDQVIIHGLPGISAKCRTGVLMENKRGGITRMVKIDEKDGYFGDIGSVYIDEIIAVVRGNTILIMKPTEHEKKEMYKTRQLTSKLFGED